MKIRIIRWTLLFALCVMQFSCGFHLRGSFELPAHLMPIYLADTGERSQLIPVLRKALITANVQLVEDKALAKSELKLGKEIFATEITSLSAVGTAQTNAMQYNVSYQLTKIGQQLLAPTSVSLSRTTQSDKNAVLSSDAELQIVKREMIDEAAQQIIRRLRYLKQ